MASRNNHDYLRSKHSDVRFPLSSPISAEIIDADDHQQSAYIDRSSTCTSFTPFVSSRPFSKAHMPTRAMPRSKRSRRKPDLRVITQFSPKEEQSRGRMEKTKSVKRGLRRQRDVTTNGRDENLRPENAFAQPQTPTILITPARDSHESSNPPHARRTEPRPRSSIYSQPSPVVYGHIQGDVPPLPVTDFKSVLPGQTSNPFKHSPTENSPELIRRASKKTKRSRPPLTISTRKLSPRSSPGTGSGSATRASRGWWNVIVTPFMAKSHSPEDGSSWRQSSGAPPTPLPRSQPISDDEWTSPEKDEKIDYQQRHEKNSSQFGPPQNPSHSLVSTVSPLSRSSFTPTSSEVPLTLRLSNAQTAIQQHHHFHPTNTEQGENSAPQPGYKSTYKPPPYSPSISSPETEPDPLPDHHRNNRPSEVPETATEAIVPLAYAASQRQPRSHTAPRPPEMAHTHAHSRSLSSGQRSRNGGRGSNGSRGQNAPPPAPRIERQIDLEKGAPQREKRSLSERRVQKSRLREKRKRQRRRCCLCWLLIGLLLIALIVGLAVGLTRKSKSKSSTTSPPPPATDNAPSSTRWVNITGWPPMYTGVSTILRPDAAVEDSGCVSPNTQWSCAVPKEEQQSIAPNKPDQPNFQFEIKHRSNSAKRSVRWLAARDDWTSNPAPPSIEEQRFLGNTTDGVVSSLKEGEQAPFYITFKTSVSAPQRIKRKRDDPFPDSDLGIPPPSLDPDGRPSPADLFPTPTLQPVRLYDRGLDTEHYGFYTYFDRSIFLSPVSPSDPTDGGRFEAGPDDQNGGSPEQEAKFRCTWAQTRFHVQIWTRSLSDSLLNDPNSSSTFPYPVSISTDRHGGDVKLKQIYCYAFNANGGLDAKNKTIQLENRGFGGRLQGGGQGPLGKNKVTVAQGGLGGIDGGTGGCACEWRNWRKGV